MLSEKCVHDRQTPDSDKVTSQIRGTVSFLLYNIFRAQSMLHYNSEDKTLLCESGRSEELLPSIGGQYLE